MYFIVLFLKMVLEVVFQYGFLLCNAMGLKDLLYSPAKDLHVLVPMTGIS